MDAAPGTERLAIARSDVHRACDLLIASTPEALNDCQNALARAVSVLHDFRRNEISPSPGLTTIARALKAEVVRARQLLENLSSFYKGWERILGAMSGGYTSSGAPAAVDRQGRFCCRG
jgi:hypothetical protein